MGHKIIFGEEARTAASKTRLIIERGLGDGVQVDEALDVALILKDHHRDQTFARVAAIASTSAFLKPLSKKGERSVPKRVWKK